MRAHDGVRGHYAHRGLRRSIRDLLAGDGPAAGRSSPGPGWDPGRIDQFHPGGRQATAALADAAGVGAGDRVLDLGCGLGGPARQLAARGAALVVGIDQSAEYAATARWLGGSGGTTPGPAIAFAAGDALALPFRDAAFSVVWSQHMQMNVADKPRLYAQLRRVLAPGGRLALYEPCRGCGPPPDLPLPWAREAGHSHLPTAGDLRAGLAEAGFAELAWADVTGRVQDWLAAAIGGHAQPRRRAPALSVLLGDDAAAMLDNLRRGLDAGAIEVVQAVFRRPPSVPPPAAPPCAT